VFGISPEVTTALLGVAIVAAGQALLMWRANAIATSRFEHIDRRLKHQDECTDDLRKKVDDGDRRIWEAIDNTGRQLANLLGRWDGVVLEREMQARARAAEGKT